MENEEQISLFKLGSLINLKISTWSGRKMLTPTDLARIGIDIKNLPLQIANLGRKCLVPTDALKRISKIEQRARMYLARWAVPFGPSACYFCPITKLSDVEAKLKELKEEFWKEVDEFIGRFDKMRAIMEKTYPEFWDKCLKAYFPANPQALRNKYGFTWHKFRISLPEDMRETNTEVLVKEMQEGVSSFVTEYISTMRSEVVKFCELMDARINGKVFADEEEPKKLTGKSLASFRKFATRFKEMNIFGDNEIQKMLNEFKDQYLTDFDSVEVFNNDQVKAGISQTLSSIREKAAAIESEQSEFLDCLKRRITI